MLNKIIHFKLIINTNNLILIKRKSKLLQPKLTTN